MKKALIIVGVLAVVALAYVGGRYMSKTREAAPVASNTAATSNPSPAPSPAPAPVSNFFTYMNTKYNFSLQFPNTWKNVKEKDISSQYTNLKPAPVVIRLYADNNTGRELTLFLFKKSDRVIVNDFPRASQYDGEIKDYVVFFDSGIFCYGPDCPATPSEPQASEVVAIFKSLK